MLWLPADFNISSTFYLVNYVLFWLHIFLSDRFHLYTAFTDSGNFIIAVDVFSDNCSIYTDMDAQNKAMSVLLGNALIVGKVQK